jgi:hypothetical protein
MKWHRTAASGTLSTKWEFIAISVSSEALGLGNLGVSAVLALELRVSPRAWRNPLENRCRGSLESDAWRRRRCFYLEYVLAYDPEMHLGLALLVVLIVVGGRFEIGTLACFRNLLQWALSLFERPRFPSLTAVPVVRPSTPAQVHTIKASGYPFPRAQDRQRRVYQADGASHKKTYHATYQSHITLITLCSTMWLTCRSWSRNVS